MYVCCTNYLSQSQSHMYTLLTRIYSSVQETKYLDLQLVDI